MRDKVPGFTGQVSDLGGPTANMYQMRCTRPEIEARCRRLSSCSTSRRIEPSLRDWIARPWCIVIEQNVQPPKQPRIVVIESLIITCAGTGAR